jgi:hypothetical protein
MAIAHDENRHIVRFAGLAPEGRKVTSRSFFAASITSWLELLMLITTVLRRSEIPLKTKCGKRPQPYKL